MNLVSLQERRRMRVALVAAAGIAIGLCCTTLAADPMAKSEPAPAATDEPKPIPPSRSELPDSAFRKLDVAGKGYVTRDDTKELEGFDAVFQQNDGNHDGRLTHDEFKRAWSTYSVKP
jgi:hypothetical protein